MVNHWCFDHMLRGIIAGSPGVGKTAILCNFCDVKENEGNILYNTIKPINNSLIRYNIWDFKTIDGYGIIKPSKYFAQPDFILFTFDIARRETYNVIPTLLTTCSSYGYDFTKIHIYILGNKILDDKEHEQVSYEEAEKYSNEINATYFEIDISIPKLNHVFTSITNDIMQKKTGIIETVPSELDTLKEELQQQTNQPEFPNTGYCTIS